jgi:hypothetical protein
METALEGIQVGTLAANVDRQTFPSQIWDKVLLPEHLVRGFRGTGIHPMSGEAIPDLKLKISSAPRIAHLSKPPNQLRPCTIPVTIRVAKYFGELFTEKQKANTRLGK